jgi:hypothetical protein
LEKDCGIPTLKSFGLTIVSSSPFTVLHICRIALPASSKRSPASVGTTGERRRSNTEFRFEFRNAGRYGRLRDGCAVRAYREAACLDDRDEMNNLVDFHNQCLRSSDKPQRVTIAQASLVSCMTTPSARDDRVPALVIGGQHFLLFGHDHRAPLRVHHDLIFRLPRERPTTISTDIPLVTKN